MFNLAARKLKIVYVVHMLVVLGTAVYFLEPDLHALTHRRGPEDPRPGWVFMLYVIPRLEEAT